MPARARRRAIASEYFPGIKKRQPAAARKSAPFLQFFRRLQHIVPGFGPFGAQVKKMMQESIPKPTCKAKHGKRAWKKPGQNWERAEDMPARARHWTTSSGHFPGMKGKAVSCSLEKRALLSVLPPFTVRYSWLWNSGTQAGGENSLNDKTWQALAPKRVPDGNGAWGCANANGPGLAVLVHKLGAGHSFTEWEKAQSGDIMKLWWTEAIGARERGHLTIYLSQTEDSLTFWSSNQSNPEGTPGYGIKTVPKTTVKHVLFTRITRPEAFTNAPSVGTDPWLGSLLKKTVTMEEMLRRCGLSPSSSEIHP